MRIERWNGGELPEDVAGVLRDGLEELGEIPEELPMTLGLAASDTAITFVAWEGGRPVGVLTAAPEPRTSSAFVRWLVVAPDARRRGVGTALVDALAATPDLAGLSGMVDQEDPAALTFWQGRGWSVRTPRPGRRRQLMGIELGGHRERPGPSGQHEVAA